MNKSPLTTAQLETLINAGALPTAGRTERTLGMLALLAMSETAPAAVKADAITALTAHRY